MGATVTYNGSVIAELNGGETKKLKTAGTYLEGDLTVEAVGGGGECDLPHIIEVDVLPTEDIDENAVYKIYKVVFIDVYISMFNINASVLCESMGKECSFNTIPTKTTEGILAFTDATWNFYYIEDEADVFIYQDGEWALASSIASDGSVSAVMNEQTTYYEHQYAFYDVVMVIDGETQLLSATEVGSGISYMVVATKPTVNISETTLYYVEDENDIFVYGGGWVTLGDAMGVSPYNGAISDVSEATADGYYALIIDWKTYVNVSGTLTITENGTYDVTNKASAVVNLPNIMAIVGIWQFNETISLGDAEWEQEVSFTSPGVVDGSGVCSNNKIRYYAVALRYATEDYPLGVGVYSNDNGWSSDAARIVNFGTDPQLVNGWFKEWLTANAKPIYNITQIE